MYCNKCGAENNEQARFCTSCGSPLGSGAVEQAGTYYAAPQQQAAPQQYAAPQQQAPAQAPYPYPYAPQAAPYGQPVQPPAKKKKTGLVVGIVAILLVAIIAVVLIVFVLPPSGDGIVGRWVVTDTDTSDFPVGIIMNFKKNGELKVELTKDAPDDVKAQMDLLDMVNITYETKDDMLVMTLEMGGLTQTNEVKFEVKDNTLTFFDNGEETVFKRVR